MKAPMTQGALYLLRGQADGQLLNEGDGERFLTGSPELLGPDQCESFKPWMSMEIDPQRFLAYRDNLEAWSLFQAGQYWFVCRLGQSGEYTGRPAYLSHAWGWIPDPDIPASHPGHLLAAPEFFWKRWIPTERTSLELAEFPAPWAGPLEAIGDRASDLLGHLYDACRQNRRLVVLTDIDDNDWHTGSRLSQMLAFAWAALPWEYKIKCQIQTSCDRPYQAMERGARVVTFDRKKNPSLTGFDPQWIVWHPASKTSMRRDSESTATCYAGHMRHLGMHAPERVPVVAGVVRGAILDQFSDQLFEDLNEIVLEIGPADRLSSGLPNAAVRLAGSDSPDQRKCLVTAAVLCSLHGYAIPEEVSEELWRPGWVEGFARELAELPCPDGGSVASLLCWAECQLRVGRESHADAVISEVCSQPGDSIDRLSALRSEAPQWTLWDRLPPEVFVRGIAWDKELPGVIRGRLRQDWEADSVSAVRKAMLGGYWHHWASTWRSEANAQEVRKMGLLWFSMSQDDALIEDWFTALDLLRPLTPMTIQKLWDQHEEGGFVVPLLYYLEDKQKAACREIGLEVGAARSAGLAEAKGYVRAFTQFGINPREVDRAVLNQVFKSRLKAGQ